MMRMCSVIIVCDHYWLYFQAFTVHCNEHCNLTSNTYHYVKTIDHISTYKIMLFDLILDFYNR